LIDSKGRNFGGFGLAYAEMAALKRKAGASSRTPYAVIYEVKYTRNYRKVNQKFERIFCQPGLRTTLMWGRNALPKTEFGVDHWS
jgi:hypothetical protein